MSSATYPGYLAWLSKLSQRDITFTCLALIVGVVLLWLFYSRRLFPRLESASRYIVLAGLYGSIVIMQIILGSAH